jgi:predicted transcriptional regulator
MSEFFDGDPTCEEIVQCIYGLNQLEFKSFCLLLQLKEADVSTLMNAIGRKERTLLNRALQNLVSKDLVVRQKRSKDGQRGYWFVYKPKPLNQVKNELMKKVESWYEKSQYQISQMELKFQKNYIKNIE